MLILQRWLKINAVLILSVYVFPFYVTPAKLQQDVPQMLGDTWLLSLDQMGTPQTFGSDQRCDRGSAVINSQYKLLCLLDSRRLVSRGISVEAFAAWYKRRVRAHRAFVEAGKRNPWLIRGLKIVIVSP
jgi:hypothetical protein